MLHRFPAEITLKTISTLPLHSLYSLSLVSREWNVLIVTNERSVYRNAAIHHRFIDEDQLTNGADSITSNWKAFCRRQLEIERGWRGKAPATVRELTATGRSVHRIKVDYELGFVITTSQVGGLFVCDIESNRILWALPPSHVEMYAHVEYDRGYIIFNRYDNSKEVWRHAIDADDDQRPGTSPADPKMLDASTQAAIRFNSAESRRGQFKAWALLRMPEVCRWFRLSFPSLLAVATGNAYVWNIPEFQLVLGVRDIQRWHRGFRLAATCYAEVNDLYVFICGIGGLRIFAREGGALLYQLPSRELSSTTWDVRPHIPTRRGSAETFMVDPQMLRCNPLGSLHGSFMACHVSASGNDLAILTTHGRLVILPGFQRLFSGSKAVGHREIAIILNFQPQPSDDNVSRYLAVGSRNGKLAIATHKGIYVVSPDIDFSRLTADCPPKPGVSITHEAVYFTYKPSGWCVPADTNTVYSVRF